MTSVGLSYAATDDSGSCGANVTYSFNGATGAMTITGTGPMTDFANKSDAPWDSYRTSITSVTITDGVTSVGKSSFGQCTSLTTVTIGNDVETIGEWAFNDCGAQFTSLTLGNSIRTIEITLSCLVQELPVLHSPVPLKLLVIMLSAKIEQLLPLLSQAMLPTLEN